MKKLLAVLLCVVALAALLLAGCQQQTNNSGGPTEPGEKITITIGIPEEIRVLDYEDNAYTKYLEEVTGYDIVIEKWPYTSSDYKNRLSTTTAAGQKLPDILWNMEMPAEDIQYYGDQGVFIDLSDYYEDREVSKNWWNMLETYVPEQDRSMVWGRMHFENKDNPGAALEDCPIYVNPTVTAVGFYKIPYMTVINQTWLDNLNLPMPTTLEELENVLRAFKTQDPNGNKIADEVPLIAARTGSNGDVWSWLTNFFIYYDDENAFNMGEDGKLYTPYTTDAYRQALILMNRWAEEGLLNTDFCIDTTITALRTKFENTFTSGNPSGNYGVVCARISNIFTLEGVAENFSALTIYGEVHSQATDVMLNCFITEDCENPDAAFNLLMAMNTREATLRMYYGIEGEDWDYAQEGELDPLGQQAEVKVYNTLQNKETDHNWNYARGAIFGVVNETVGETASNRIKHMSILEKDLREAYAAAWEKVDKSQICPYLQFNSEEKDIAKNRNTVKQEIKNWRAHFVVGDAGYDINKDADWNKYLQRLEELGVKDYLAAAQKCYDRMYGSK